MTATTSKLGADMTDEQKNAIDHAQKILRAVKLYDLAAVLTRQPATIDNQEAGICDQCNGCGYSDPQTGGICSTCNGSGGWPSNAAPLANEASNPAAPSVEQDERGAFEAAFAHHGAVELVRLDDGYISPVTNCLWMGWQARAASTSANVAQSHLTSSAVESNDRQINAPVQAANVAQGAAAVDFKALVNRFLAWPLPQTVASDGCATNSAYAFPRSGTNLLNADEAEAMLRHVLANVAQGAEAVAYAAQFDLDVLATNQESHKMRLRRYSHGARTIPLYTAPPAQAALTDEQIDQIMQLVERYGDYRWAHCIGGRAYDAKKATETRGYIRTLLTAAQPASGDTK